MCLVAFAINASARWPLVIASNRDESYERPTLPMQRWESPSGQIIISGRDLLAGGTWMGVTPDGRAAFLTNVREPPLASVAAPKSRGELVTRWLEGGQTAMEFMASVDATENGYVYILVDNKATSQPTHWNLADVLLYRKQQSCLHLHYGMCSRKQRCYGAANHKRILSGVVTLA